MQLTDGAGRAAQVRRAALEVFSRYGYRKTSMEQVAAAGGVSRAGLYFMFDSKQALFGECVLWALQEDLAAAQQALRPAGRSLRSRLLDGFDQWAGRYIGSLDRDVAALVRDHPDLLGPAAQHAPLRFAGMVHDAISRQPELGHRSADQVARTLISTSVGIKHEVEDRGAYLDRLAVAIDLLLPADVSNRPGG